jgi:hypothetical protein
MVNTCTLVPHKTISVAVTEGQMVYGVYVDAHAACTLLVIHPKPTACKTIIVQLHGIKKGKFISKKVVPI